MTPVPIGSIAMSGIVKPATTVLGAVSKTHLPLKHRIPWIYDLLYIIYLEPMCPLFCVLDPQNKVFYDQNKGHLGSRYWQWSSERLHLGFGAIDLHLAWPCRISSAQLPLYAWESGCVFGSSLLGDARLHYIHPPNVKVDKNRQMVCTTPSSLINICTIHSTECGRWLMQKKDGGNKHMYINQMSCEWRGGKTSTTTGWWYFSPATEPSGYLISPWPCRRSASQRPS